MVGSNTTFSRPFGLWAKDGGFRFLYENDSAIVPEQLQFVETVLLALQAWTLLHAVVTRRMSVWVGVLLFGLFQETLGWALDTHLHGQFRFQLLEFLPLKEALIYQMMLYHSVIAVQRLGINSAWASGIVFSFVNHFSNVPYDWMGARKGLEFWEFDKGFPLANFDNPRTWHGGNAAVFYSWLCMGFTFGAVFAVARRNDLPPLNMTLALGAAAPLSDLLWTPFHILKMVGCAGAHRGGATGWIQSFVRNPAQEIVRCIRRSPVSDAHCYYTTYATILLLLPWAMAKRGRSVSNVWPTTDADNLVLGSVVGYFALMVILLNAYDAEPELCVPVAQAWTLFAIITHFTCHNSTPGFQLSDKVASNNSSSKTNKKKTK